MKHYDFSGEVIKEVVLRLLSYKSIEFITMIPVILPYLFSTNIVLAKPSKAELEQKADSIYNEGFMLYENCRYEDAIDKFKQALAMHRILGRLKNVASELNSLSEAYHSLSQYNKALAYGDSALLIAKETRDRKIECKSFNNIGAAHIRLDHYDTALVHLDSALIIAREIGDRYGEGISLDNIGFAYWAFGQYDRALAYHDTALRIRRDIKDRKGEGNTLQNIGSVYSNLSQYDKALAYFDTALVINRQTKHRKGEGVTLSSIGLVYWSFGKYNKALSYLDSALVIRREVQDKHGEGATLNNIGLVYDELSKYDRALAYYDSALIMTRITESKYGEAAILSNKGIIYNMILNQYEKALAHYDSALTLDREIKNRYGEGISLNNIGGVYQEIGQYDRALAYRDSALMIARELKNRSVEASALNNIGIVYIALSQYEKALAYYDSALSLTRELKARCIEGMILDNIGNIHNILNQHDRALAYSDSALVIMKELRNVKEQGLVFITVGEIYSNLGKYEKALAYYDSALSIAKRMKIREEEANILDNIGQVYEKMWELEQAISYYKEAIEIKESIRKELHREAFRISYSEKERDVYERLIYILITYGHYEEAFDYMERSRSEKLRRSFEESGIAAYDPSLRRVLERINFLEAEMEGLKNRSRIGEIEEEEFEIKKNELEGKLNQRLIDLKYHYPQLYNVMAPQRRTLKIIQETMPENTAFLEFMLVGDKYVIFLFSRDIFVVKATTEMHEEIDNLITETISAVKSRAKREELDKCLRKLYNSIIKPVEHEIGKYQNIVVIPYGVLHYLPFQTLRRENEHGEFEYFIDWKRISYLPSASFLIDLEENTELAEKELLAFGNADGTLPNAEIEVDRIAQIFSQSLVFKSEEATKERFIALCDKYRFLHLATHGKLDTDPRFSYIVLAPPNVGNLTVREILGLSGCFNLSTLVTLSACETAVEREPKNAGMELTTLSNAFKVAGVSSIIATLWEITDRSTAIIMKCFYENLEKKKMTKLEALRRAQMDMIINPRYSHPYYWAPFILIGDW